MSLESQVAALKFEVAELKAVVKVQGQLLRRLLADSTGESEFEVVSEASSARSPPAPENSVSAPSSVPVASVAAPVPAAIRQLSQQEREDIARGIGRFLRGSLEGRHTGLSGQDRNPLKSRVYILCRDHAGRDITPPVLVDRSVDAAARCKRGADCGASVFVGVPST